MDTLTKELQTFLVRLSYQPETVSHQTEHYLEHLFHLLPADEEEAVLHYFGVLGHRQEPLAQLARERNLSSEAMMEQIFEDAAKYKAIMSALAHAMFDELKAANA